MSSVDTFKVVICGDFAVGKTTIVKTFLDEDQAFVEGYKPTIGVDIGRKSFILDSQTITFQIWDLSGQQSFKMIRPQFYNRSHGVILVFDMTRKESFTNLPLWLDEILGQTDKIPFVLVGNKLDLVESAEEAIFQQKATEFANNVSSLTGFRTPYIQTSALKQLNCIDPFLSLGKLIIKN